MVTCDFLILFSLTESTKDNVVDREVPYGISSGSRFECGFGLDYFSRDENYIKLSDRKTLAHKGEMDFFWQEIAILRLLLFLPKRSSLNPDLLSNKNEYCCPKIFDPQCTSLFFCDSLIDRVAWPI